MKEHNMFDLLFWVSLIIASALAVWAAVGDSPSFDQIMLTLMITMLPVFFSIRERTSEIIQKIESVDDTLRRMEETLNRMGRQP